MNKIGVFGGTFDPVHYGHIYLARQAADECSLDSIIVVPAKMQPFKLDRALTQGEHRFNMLKLAFPGDEAISVSDIELKKNGISYTIDTLREIKSLHSGANISFILGADAFLNIEKWKCPEELIQDYSFIIGARPGIEPELGAFISRLQISAAAINNRQVAVSSTEIKRMLESGESLSGMIPKEVERYIRENGLYQGLY